MLLILQTKTWSLTGTLWAINGEKNSMKDNLVQSKSEFKMSEWKQVLWCWHTDESKVLQCANRRAICSSPKYKTEQGLEQCVCLCIHCTVKIHCILYVYVRWASCEPKWATYNPWGFGALCGIVGKAATVTSGDCVWLLVTEAHGIHRLASAADDPLQRETRRHSQWIHFILCGNAAHWSTAEMSCIKYADVTLFSNFKFRWLEKLIYVHMQFKLFANAQTERVHVVFCMYRILSFPIKLTTLKHRCKINDE